MGDNRSNMTQEALINIKMIKQYGYQEFFKDQIKKLLDGEIKIRFLIANNLILVKFISGFLPALMSSLSLAIFISYGYKLDLAQTIEILMLFKQAQEPIQTCLFELKDIYLKRQIATRILNLFMETKEIK